MAKVTRAQIAQVFRTAVPHLARNIQDRKSKSSFICFAISDAANNTVLEGAADAACLIIEKRLEGSSTLGDWLLKKGVKEELITVDRLQKHRHYWLKQLISEYEKPKARR